MGYTHYFADLKVNAALADFAKDAVKESGVAICGATGGEKPVINPTSIQLNGSAKKEEDYESFVLPANGFGGFCKTARRPYDSVVTAILIDAIVEKVDGWENISSDGDIDDWIESGGVDLFSRVYEKHGKSVDYRILSDGIEMFLRASGSATREEAGYLMRSGISNSNDSTEDDNGNAGRQTIEIKYHTDKIEKLRYIGGKSDWIDLRAAEDVVLKEGEFALISLGISVKLPEGYEMIIAPRSSTFKNFGVLQTNGIGVIDETYCGDGDIIRFPAYAVRDTEIHVNDRICQFRIQKHQPTISFHEVDHLDGKNRGGFGSTGKK